MTVEQLEVVITANSDDLDAKMSVVNNGLVQLEQNALAVSSVGIGAMKAVADKIAETDWSFPNLDETDNLIGSKVNHNMNVSGENASVINKNSGNNYYDTNESDSGLNSKMKRSNSSFESVITGTNAAVTAYEASGETEKLIDNIVSAEPVMNAASLETAGTSSVYSDVINYYNSASETEVFGYSTVTDILSAPDNKTAKQDNYPAPKRVYDKDGYINNTGGETRIVLEVDGDVLAETVMKSQNSRMIRANGMYM